MDKNENWKPVENQKKSKSLLELKGGDKIRFKSQEDEEFQKGIVVSRAGKTSGVNRNQFNVRLNEDEGIQQIHLDKYIVQKLKTQ